MPTVLGSIVLLAAPAWAQSRNGKDDRNGDTNRNAQTGTIGKTAQTPAAQTNNPAANAAARRADAEAAARAGTYAERNANIYGQSVPYGGFGTSYYGYAYPNYSVSSYYYPYYGSAVTNPYASIYTAAVPTVPVATQPVVPTVPVATQTVVPPAVETVVPAAAPAVVLVSANTSVLVTVDVPPNAEVWFNGAPTAQPGTVRRYISPPLNPGMDYTYFVRARWTEDGVPIDRTRRVTVHAGDQLTVDFPYVR